MLSWCKALRERNAKSKPHFLWTVPRKNLFEEQAFVFLFSNWKNNLRFNAEEWICDSKVGKQSLEILHFLSSWIYFHHLKGHLCAVLFLFISVLPRQVFTVPASRVSNWSIVYSDRLSSWRKSFDKSVSRVRKSCQNCCKRFLLCFESCWQTLGW